MLQYGMCSFFVFLAEVAAESVHLLHTAIMFLIEHTLAAAKSPLAQLVERATVNREASSSILLWRAIFFFCLFAVHRIGVRVVRIFIVCMFLLHLSSFGWPLLSLAAAVFFSQLLAPST